MWDGTSAFTHGKTWTNSAKTRGPIRMTRVRKDGRLRRRRVEKMPEPLEIVDQVGRHSLKYHQVCIDILSSLVSDKKIRRFVGNLAGQDVRSVMSCVFWPLVWQSIWKQFSLDIPRCRVLFNGNVWKDPHLLFEQMEKSMSPMESRWTCALVNQAPLADVYKIVWHDAKNKYGQQCIVCDDAKSEEAGLEISIKYTHDSFAIEYKKRFRIFSRDAEVVAAHVDTHHVISCSCESVETTWKFE